MLIYNEKLSVSPLSTNLPLRLVAKNITKEKEILMKQVQNISTVRPIKLQRIISSHKKNSTSILT